MERNQQLEIYNQFRREYEQITQQYSTCRSPEYLIKEIHRLSQNENYRFYSHFLIFLGDSYMENGDFEAGAACMKAVEEYFPQFHHYEIFYLRMAQYHIEKGDTETGIDFLFKLCTEVKDYQARIAINELTDVWETYKSFLSDRIPEFITGQKPAPLDRTPAPQSLSPGECSQSIRQILSQPDFLADLSNHLAERTANGAFLNGLNKWERVFYYSDELCREVNSGGFEHYLYYHGTHFSKACQAFSLIGAEQMVSLMGQVQRKFPNSRMPKSQQAIQNAVDRLEDSGTDFENEDELYYSSAEKKLLECLKSYVKDNAEHFR